MKRVYAFMVVATGLGMAGDAHARLLSRRDTVELADRAAQRVVVEDVEAIQAMLSAQGLNETETQRTAQGLVNRMVRDMRAFATSLEGRSFDTMDTADDHVRERWLVLRFSALNAPQMYAKGRPMTYVVTDDEARRLERSLTATWIEREPLLRKRLDDMMLMNEISPSQVTAVRQWTRKLATERGKEAITGLRGMSFFSAADADYYLECAVVAEIERVRGEQLGDPTQRKSFIDDAVVEFGAIEDGALVDARPAKRPSFETAKSSATSEIDFNK